MLSSAAPSAGASELVSSLPTIASCDAKIAWNSESAVMYTGSCDWKIS
jgi:hypothetical protein